MAAYYPIMPFMYLYTWFAYTFPPCLEKLRQLTYYVSFTELHLSFSLPRCEEWLVKKYLNPQGR